MIDQTVLTSLLEKSSCGYSHLCPRQVLGVRIGLAGLAALGFHSPPDKNHILVITETDGWFADGLSAATGCTMGHRNLRLEDYGKIAAVFIHLKTGQSVRIEPTLDVRQRAYAYAPEESRHFFAQLQGYQVMPDSELLTIQPIKLNVPVETITSRPGVRVNCDVCGEEIINEREIRRDGETLCQACALGGYYTYLLPVQQHKNERVYSTPHKVS